MTKSLTEKWKDGELEEGFYYILFASRFGKDYIAIDMFIQDEKDFMYSSCEDVKEVLGPVPDYMDCKRLRYDSIELDKAKIKIYELVSKTDELKKKLKIATKALSDIEDGYSEATGAGQSAREALKEMEGVK